MKHITTTVCVILLLVCNSTFGQKTLNQPTKSEQAFNDHSPTLHHEIALEVLAASKDWIENFNQGNAEACVNGYTENATMSALPFGVKNGKQEITDFWTPFLSSGATNLIYTEVQIEVVNDSTSFLSANWSMNVGHGIIYQEKWVKINTEWKLSYDDFEVIEQFESPKENATNPIGSHLVLENIINASKEWIKAFNQGNGIDCGNGYASNGFMNAVPFASVQSREAIQVFWNGLIANGAKNLIYHNPVFKAYTDESATLSSHWSMNIGEGKIYQEKWKLIEGKWLLTYDEFEVLKQY